MKYLIIYKDNTAEEIKAKDAEKARAKTIKPVKAIFALLTLLLLFTVNGFSQSATSGVSIIILPYTYVETNNRGAIIDYTNNGAVVSNIEISIRNNVPERITSLSAFVNYLSDSTEIRVKLVKTSNGEARIFDEQYIDVNPRLFANNIISSCWFTATYVITTKVGQDIDKIMESVVWNLTVGAK